MLPGRLGEVEFDGELPARRDVGAVFDELDYQMACQAYLWALPLVSYAQWQRSTTTCSAPRTRTSSTTSATATGSGSSRPTRPRRTRSNFFDLAETGPLVIEFPAGPTAGGVSDFWQREFGVLGEMGPDEGRGGKHLIVPPGQDAADGVDGYALQATGMNVMFGFRTLDPGPGARAGARRRGADLPVRAAGRPAADALISPDGRAWSGDQPRGLAYWERLHDIYQSRDRRRARPLLPGDAASSSASRRAAVRARRSAARDPGGRVGRRRADGAGEHVRQAVRGARYWPDRQWDLAIVLDNSAQRGRTTTSCWNARPGSTRRSASPRR